MSSFASQAPRVGDWVIAVGNPFGLGGTVTAGIVSARGRDIGAGPYDDFLQIDAPVNHGNSGGPTFNAQGEVVGVNTAIFSPSGGSVGIGFAIASDVAKTVVQQLKDNGKVARGWLGVQIQPVSQDIADSLGLKDAKGAIVDKAEKDSPAAAAGLKDGDVITSVNGEAVADSHDLARKIAALGPKKEAELTIVRNGSPQTVKVMLGSLSDDHQAKADEPEQRGKDAMTKYGMALEPATCGRGRRQDRRRGGGDRPRRRGRAEGPPDRRRDPHGRRQVGVPAFRGRLGDQLGQVRRQEVGADAGQERQRHAFRRPADGSRVVTGRRGDPAEGVSPLRPPRRVMRQANSQRGRPAAFF